MFLDFFVVVSCATTVALIWRTLLMQHKRLLTTISSIPYLGNALTCGFCSTTWISLIAVCIANPLGGFTGQAALDLLIGWWSITPSVLLFRNAVALVMESNGLVTDMHLARHKEDQ